MIDEFAVKSVAAVYGLAWVVTLAYIGILWAASYGAGLPELARSRRVRIFFFRVDKSVRDVSANRH